MLTSVCNCQGVLSLPSACSCASHAVSVVQPSQARTIKPTQEQRPCSAATKVTLCRCWMALDELPGPNVPSHPCCRTVWFRCHIAPRLPSPDVPLYPALLGCQFQMSHCTLHCWAAWSNVPLPIPLYPSLSETIKLFSFYPFPAACQLGIKPIPSSDCMHGFSQCYSCQESWNRLDSLVHLHWACKIGPVTFQPSQWCFLLLL